MITIEKAEDKDISGIKKLLAALYSELGDESDSALVLSEDLIRNLMNNGCTMVLKAITENNELIGILTLTETQSVYAGGKYGVIDELFIQKQYRSIKVGERLIEKACKIAKSKNWKRITVTAPESDNERAVHFYETNDFVFAGPKLKRTQF